MKAQFAEELMRSSDIYGVSGTKVLEGSRSGQNVGILCLTHGNEQAPLAVLPKVLNQIQGQLRGNLILVMVNPEAYKANKRFLEKDMNRVFTSNGPNGDSLEEKRARILLPVFNKLDIAVDLHTAPSIPGANAFTIIPGKTDPQRELGNQFDVDYNVLYPSYVNGTGSTSDAFLSENKTCITLELGSEDEVDVRSQIDNLLRYLVYTQSIDPIALPNKRLKNITLDATQMEFVKDPKTLEFDKGFVQRAFEPVVKGQVIARADGEEFLVKEDGFLIFTRNQERFRQGADPRTEPFVYLGTRV